MKEALRKRPEDKAAAGNEGMNADNPEWTVGLKEVKDRYDKAFHPDHIRVKWPPNPKWRGLLGAVCD